MNKHNSPPSVTRWRFHSRMPLVVLAAAGTAWLALPTLTRAAADAPTEAAIARDLAASCAACHGTNGQSAGGFPSLAGTDRTTLIEKLKGFRSGTLPATVMHQHAKGYDEVQLQQLADYFARQPRAAQQ